MIYFAPLQGFTDYVYRNAYASIFNGVDAFFIPYILIKNEFILSKYRQEVLPKNNPTQRIVPQVLAKNSVELLLATSCLSENGYEELNLNLGCPYPMVTKRGRGSGLLPNPEKIEKMLSEYFKNNELELSVKLRVGLNSEEEIEKVVPVLNSFPLKEVILHPRTAKQLYSGEVYDKVFLHVSNNIKHKLVYNGDISTLLGFRGRQKQFPGIEDWMIGRGILMNPFLPSEICGKSYSAQEKKTMLFTFHQLIFEKYSEIMDNDGNVLNKLKQFWFYFSANFQNSRKAFKAVKKSNNINKYKSEVAVLFADYG